MSYALRNSLILAVLLALTLGAGAYWLWVRQARQMDALRTRKHRLEGELARAQTVVAKYDSTRARLARLQTRWKARTQVVPASDTPARTLAFLNALQKKTGSAVQFDFFYKGRRDRKGYSVNGYGLEGQARFENLYAFLWDLEHGRRFYTVDQLELVCREGDVGTPRWDWVQFKVLLRAYFDPKSRIQDPGPLAHAGRPRKGIGNPFRPLITRTLPKNAGSLFEVDGARLEGLSQGLAYLVDRTGRRFLLHEGDRVYLGRLSRVDLDHNRAVFILNEGGIWKRVDLTVHLAADFPGR